MTVEEVTRRKRELRRDRRIRRAELVPTERARASADAARHLLELPEVTGRRLVAFYAPLGDEADPLPAARTLLRRGASIALPRVEATELVLVATPDLDALSTGYRGVREPLGPAVDPAAVAAIVVPGVAFDRFGGRLGQGGGHYDRLLAALPRDITRIGFCFACQLVAEVPSSPHDELVDVVVTEEGVIRIRPVVA
ncbi:MAG: 5-formyltetrahydrofolate cyclo-ligase [Actinobacteria bacterium]|nr:5-formyltetrahydrofolate cyclo-ligase [Actinomycetota bacterium]